MVVSRDRRRTIIAWLVAPAILLGVVGLFTLIMRLQGLWISDPAPEAVVAKVDPAPNPPNPNNDPFPFSQPLPSVHEQIRKLDEINHRLSSPPLGNIMEFQLPSEDSFATQNPDDRIKESLVRDVERIIVTIKTQIKFDIYIRSDYNKLTLVANHTFVASKPSPTETMGLVDRRIQRLSDEIRNIEISIRHNLDHVQNPGKYPDRAMVGPESTLHLCEDGLLDELSEKLAELAKFRKP